MLHTSLFAPNFHGKSAVLPIQIYRDLLTYFLAHLWSPPHLNVLNAPSVGRTDLAKVIMAVQLAYSIQKSIWHLFLLFNMLWIIQRKDFCQLQMIKKPRLASLSSDVRVTGRNYPLWLAPVESHKITFAWKSKSYSSDDREYMKILEIWLTFKVENLFVGWSCKICFTVWTISLDLFSGQSFLLLHPSWLIPVSEYHDEKLTTLLQNLQS